MLGSRQIDVLFSIQNGNSPFTFTPRTCPNTRGKLRLHGSRSLDLRQDDCRLYFFDVKDGHTLFDKSGFVCEDDTDALNKATVLAIGVSVDKPEDDPERRVAIINDEGHEIGNVPVYSKPSYQNPAK
jgi:hypothetical protein